MQDATGGADVWRRHSARRCGRPATGEAVTAAGCVAMATGGAVTAARERTGVGRWLTTVVRQSEVRRGPDSRGRSAACGSMRGGRHSAARCCGRGVALCADGRVMPCDAVGGAGLGAEIYRYNRKGGAGMAG